MIVRPTPWVVLLALHGPIPALVGQPSGVAPFAPPEEKPRETMTDDEFRLPLEAATATELGRLIPLLNAPAPKEREQATQRLIEIGAPAFAKLREAYASSDDLESRLRVEEVVRTAYLNHHVLDRNGFLGVSLDPVEAQRAQRAPNTPEAEGGLRIRQVTTGTGAAKAGLRAEDVILALNGNSVRGEGRDRFSDAIRQNRPGTVVRLDILRDGRPMVVNATLGRCPENVLRTSNVLFKKDYHEVNDRFPEWWHKYFVNPAVAAAGSP